MVVQPASRSRLIAVLRRGGHDSWGVAGVDLGAIFVLGDVSDPVQPVSRCPSGHGSRLREWPVVAWQVGNRPRRTRGAHCGELCPPGGTTLDDGRRSRVW